MFDLIPFGRNERNLFQYLDNVEKSLFDGLDTRVSRFRTDILDKGDRYLLEAELPGFDLERILLNVNRPEDYAAARAAAEEAEG